MRIPKEEGRFKSRPGPVQNSSPREMKRAIVLAVGLALSLALLAWGLAATGVSLLIVNLLNLIAVLTIVGIAVYVLSQCRLSRRLMLGLAAAVILCVAMQILFTAGSIDALDNVPVFGNETASHKIVLRAMKLAAITILAMSLFMAAVESSHDKRILARHNEELRTEIEDRKRSDIDRQNLGRSSARRMTPL